MSIIQHLFLRSPNWLKEIAFSGEAIRRNWYRRYGDYNSIRKEFSFANIESLSREQIELYQIDRINSLIEYAKVNCPFYKNRFSLNKIAALNDILSIPILQKEEIRNNLKTLISTTYNKRNLWWTYTSGSTGKPLKYCVSRESIRIRYAIHDNYFELYSLPWGAPRARLSGILTTPINNEEPPFWVFNRVFNQLQMSAYHISSKTAVYYINKLIEFKPVAIIGYPHSIYLLASFMLENSIRLDCVKVIFTDSENLIDAHKQVIENAFNVKCKDAYGLGEITGGAFLCENDQYIEMYPTCLIEVVDEKGNPSNPGEPGRIIITDLVNYASPFIRYETGDIGVLSTGCNCKWHNIKHIREIVGRVDDMILTTKGRWVGRLSHVTKPGIGILESQIVQKQINEIEILIVPALDFQAESMTNVLKTAKDYLGSDMNVTWRIVKEIPPDAKSHKIKHVVRNPSIGIPLFNGLT